MEYIVPLVLIGAIAYFIFFRKGAMGGGCCGGGGHQNAHAASDGDGSGQETGAPGETGKKPPRSCH